MQQGAVRGGGYGASVGALRSRAGTGRAGWLGGQLLSRSVCCRLASPREGVRLVASALSQ